MRSFINFNILSSSQLCINLFAFFSFQLVINSPTKKGMSRSAAQSEVLVNLYAETQTAHTPKRGVSVRSNSCVPKIYQISD